MNYQCTRCLEYIQNFTTYKQHLRNQLCTSFIDVDSDNEDNCEPSIRASPNKPCIGGTCQSNVNPEIKQIRKNLLSLTIILCKVIICINKLSGNNKPL